MQRKEPFAVLVSHSDTNVVLRLGGTEYKADSSHFKIHRKDKNSGEWVLIDTLEHVQKPWIRKNFEQMHDRVVKRKMAEIFNKTGYVYASQRKRQERHKGAY